MYNLAVRSVIILFAKSPEPGRVKTRLADRLGAEAAARLYEAFVRDVLETLYSLAGAADLELHTDIPTDAWPEAAVPRRLQAEGDLGAKMFHALERALREGRPRAMIAGSDAPTLPAGHVEKLLASDADVALGPTEDGGYYAIGCQRVHPAMFDGVRWSQPSSLEETARAARACGLTVVLGESWFDVDGPEDLERLLQSGRVPRHTARIMDRGP